MKSIVTLLAICFFTVGLNAKGTDHEKKTVTPTTMGNDSTGTNTNNNMGNMGATHQANNATDVELTRSIREKINRDNSISTMGKNVTIVSQGGHVTLSGPVSSNVEKMKIQKIAKDMAAGKVSDQTTVSK